MSIYVIEVMRGTLSSIACIVLQRLPEGEQGFQLPVSESIAIAHIAGLTWGPWIQGIPGHNSRVAVGLIRVMSLGF